MNIVKIIINTCMKKIIILVTICLMLSSCGTVGKLMPSLGYSKDNQSTSSTDTLSQSIGHASVALTAGTNKTKSYGDKSNIKSSDLNLDSTLNQSTSANSWGGTHTDNSKKFINSTTQKGNKENKYNATHQNVYNRTPLINQIFICLSLFIVFVSMWYLAFVTGKKIGTLKTRLSSYRKNRRIKINEKRK